MIDICVKIWLISVYSYGWYLCKYMVDICVKILLKSVQRYGWYLCKDMVDICVKIMVKECWKVCSLLYSLSLFLESRYLCKQCICIYIYGFLILSIFNLDWTLASDKTTGIPTVLVISEVLNFILYTFIFKVYNLSFKSWCIFF